MSDMQISQILHQMRTLAATAQQGAAQEAPGVSGAGGFSELLKQSLEQVNTAQKVSKDLAQAFEAGDPSVNLVQVMIAKEKASLAFDATTQVRNKLLEAYKDVMNMPV